MFLSNLLLSLAVWQKGIFMRQRQLYFYSVNINFYNTDNPLTLSLFDKLDVIDID